MITELVGIAAVGGIVYYLAVARPRGRRAQIHRGLHALAPLLVEPTVENAPLISTPGSHKLHLRGGYQGFQIEAWPERSDPRPADTAGNESTLPVNQFVVRCVGVNGALPWTCTRRRVSLNPFDPPEIVFTPTLDLNQFLSGPLAEAIGIPRPDPELEERLRAAGLIEEITQLGHGAHIWLPQVRFVPAMGFFGAIGPANTSWLECRVEVEHGVVPTVERFQQLLGCLLRLADINARGNHRPR